MKHSFGSDNHSGVAPVIMEAIINANNEVQVAYGEDEITDRAIKEFKKVLGENAHPFFVPPNEMASTPRSAVKLLIDILREAEAFEMREPSTCR